MYQNNSQPDINHITCSAGSSAASSAPALAGTPRTSPRSPRPCRCASPAHNVSKPTGASSENDRRGHRRIGDDEELDHAQIVIEHLRATYGADRTGDELKEGNWALGIIGGIFLFFVNLTASR